MIRIACLFLLFITQISFAKKLPVEAFGQLPAARQVKLSPDGSKLGYIRNFQGGTLLAVMNTTSGDVSYVAKTDNQKFKISWFVWANDDTLLVSAIFPSKRFGNGGFATATTETRLMSIKADGKSKMNSVIKVRRSDNYPQFQDNIISMLPDDPDHVLIAMDLDVMHRPSVFKANVNGGISRERIQRAMNYVKDWYADRQGNLRLAFCRDDTKIFYRYLNPQSNEWQKIWQYELFEQPDITPLGFDLDPNILFVRANHEGRYAVFKVNMADPELKKELVYSDPEYDIEGGLIYSSKDGHVIGLVHGEAENAKVYFDKNYERFQEALNKAIPNAYNSVVSWSKDETKYILYSSKANSPGTYYFGDRKKGTLDTVISEYPLLAGADLPSQEHVSFKARDGLNIEGYVTVPTVIKEKYPAIILPHGGPMARDYAGFDWLASFIANKGIVVFQPNFRGSSGYGFDFEMQSVKKWGKEMQDDLADAAHWLGGNYPIDQNKICILGASYGGYAALMAAVKQGNTFKCATSINGVTDLKRIVLEARKYTNYKVVKKQIGDDYDELEEASPVYFAEKINIPILLIHGNMDRVVPVLHSQAMFDELKDFDKNVKYVELENGNHSLQIQENRIKALNEIDLFLDKYLM